jgi:3-oxoacyl-[acyl-carrier protein] reductase
MNILITGGSRGIGRDLVLKFAREGYGCAFTYRGNKEKAEETVALTKEAAPEGKIRSYALDLGNSEEIEKTVETVMDDFGDIHCLVNNAAMLRDNAAAFMTDDEWESVIRTNLSGPFYMIRSLLMNFVSNRMGRIINISSLAQDGSSGQVNYAASKAGLIGLSNTIAREYGPKNITSNIVVVGYVPTDMTRDNMAQRLKSIWDQYCPMKRSGKASEISGLVHYLTTPDASFINGEIIHVSGGLTYVP